MEGETDSPTTGTKKSLPWNRRAYNLIWNRYFKEEAAVERALDQSDFASCSLRPTTFHESAHRELDIGQTLIPGFGSTSSVDLVRQAFAEDRFNRIREYYGSKYSDYLAALGVKSGWSIPEDPEPIGKSQKDMNYRTISATATEGTTEYLADPAGYWETKNVQTINKTFCPEHGLIVSVGVAKMDTFNLEGNVPPCLAKTDRRQYYSPEQKYETVREWEGELWGSAQTDPQKTRVFE